MTETLDPQEQPEGTEILEFPTRIKKTDPPIPPRWEILEIDEVRVSPGDEPGTIGLRLDSRLTRYGDVKRDFWRTKEPQAVSRIFCFRSLEELRLLGRTLSELAGSDIPPDPSRLP